MCDDGVAIGQQGLPMPCCVRMAQVATGEIAEIALARLQLDLGRRAAAKATYERILPDASGDVKALVEARLAALRDAS